MDGVAAVDGPGILLARDEGVAVALEAARRTPRRLPEVRAGHVAHLQEVGDVHVLGRHLRPGVFVADRVALDVHRFVDVEGVSVVDVEADQPARDALPAAHRARLDLVAVGAHTQFGVAQAVGVRDARPAPVDLAHVAGLAAVGAHAECRGRRQGGDRGPEHAHGEEPTGRRLHPKHSGRITRTSPWRAPSAPRS